MNKYLKVAAPVAIAATVFWTGWWIETHRVGATTPVAMSVETVPASTPAHEKVFLEEQLRKKPRHSPVLLRLAQIERESGNLADARRHLEQAVAGDRKLVDARLELSLVYYQMNNVKAALEQNRTILRENPKQTDALYNLGAISANQGEIDAARSYWREAIASGPETPSGKKATDSLKQLSATSMRPARE